MASGPPVCTLGGHTKYTVRTGVVGYRLCLLGEEIDEVVLMDEADTATATAEDPASVRCRFGAGGGCGAEDATWASRLSLFSIDPKSMTVGDGSFICKKYRLQQRLR